MGKPEWSAPTLSVPKTLPFSVPIDTVFRPAVFPWLGHTIHRHPMSSISVRRISHLSRTRALTPPLPTRYHGCCFHSLGGEEEVARGPHRPGSAPAMGSRSPEEEGADLRRDSGSGTGAQPEPARRARRGSGAGAATRSKGEPAYPMYYIGAGEGLGPFEPPTGESSPLAPPSPPPLPSPSPLTEPSLVRCRRRRSERIIKDAHPRRLIIFLSLAIRSCIASTVKYDPGPGIVG